LRQTHVTEFINQDPGFRRAWRRCPLELKERLFEPPEMRPACGAPQSWPVPAILTPAELAGWLGIHLRELDWFADPRSREADLPDGPLRHYRYRWIRKRGGSARLIESPKPRLKELQRLILHEILDLIPPHPAAHGFHRGRSCRSFVASHVGRQVVLRMDLQDFFPSISRARVLALFLTAGYPEAVALMLAGLCTNSVPPEIWEHPPGLGGFDACHRTERRRLERLYRWPHVPQGAPTSPALANLCALRLDRRLAGLARSAGAEYTRYADDLLFSGGADLARTVSRFALHTAAICEDEGFALNLRKTRIMRPGVRQMAAGIVLNRYPNLPRVEYDRLKAMLFNCVRHSPEAENRAGHPDFRAHLAGRVAYAEHVNPARGRRLRELFDRIKWYGGRFQAD
jgi:hypothetical protein